MTRSDKQNTPVNSTQLSMLKSYSNSTCQTAFAESTIPPSRMRFVLLPVPSSGVLFKVYTHSEIEFKEPSYVIFLRCIRSLFLAVLLLAMSAALMLSLWATYRKEKETTLISARGNQALSQRRILSVIKITSPHPCNCSSKLAVSAAYTKKEKKVLLLIRIRLVPTQSS